MKNTNEAKLENRGKYEVYVYGERYVKCIWCRKDNNGEVRNYVKHYSELIEVFRKSMCYSSEK